MQGYLSSKSVIEAIRRRFGLRHSSIPKTDVIEFIAEAIGLLEYGIGMDIQFHESNIEFYRAGYPCDMVDLYNIYYNGKLLPEYRCRNTCRYQRNPIYSFENEVISKINVLEKNQKLSEDVDSYLEGNITKTNLLEDILTANTSHLILEHGIQVSTNHWYKKNIHNIETSIEEGNITIEYLTFAVDDEGYPLVLDEIKYRLAIEHYVLYNLILSGYKHPTIKLDNAEYMKDRAMQKAKNQNKKLGIKELDEFKNVFTNLLGRVDTTTPYYSN